MRDKVMLKILSYRNFNKLFFASTIVLASFAILGCSGTQGPAGNDGKNGSTWYSGTECVEEQGVIGDFFYDTDDCNIYQKTENGWVLISNIQGPQGEQGIQGSQGETGKNGSMWLTGSTAPDDSIGNDGDLYLNVTTCDLYQKNNGSWGQPICNIKGAQGDQGDKGESGRNGTKWFTGTAITGIGDNIVVLVEGASIGDLYLNIDTANVYECIAESTWKHLTSLTTGDYVKGEDDKENKEEIEVSKEEIDITSKFNWISNLTISSITQGSTYVIGEPCASINFKASDYVDVSRYVGRKIRITLPVYCTNAGNRATMAICAYDDNQNYLSTIKQLEKANTQSLNTAEYIEFEVEEDFSFIRTPWYNDDYSNYTFEGGFSCVVLAVDSNLNPDESGDIDNENIYEMIDLAEIITFVANRGLRVSDGKTQNSENFKTAEYVDVEKYVGRTIRITLPVYTTSTGGQCPFGLVGYNASYNKNVVLRQVPMADENGSTVEIFEFEVPSGVKYIRFSYFNDTYEHNYDGVFSCAVLPKEI